MARFGPRDEKLAMMSPRASSIVEIVPAMAPLWPVPVVSQAFSTTPSALLMNTPGTAYSSPSNESPWSASLTRM